MAMISWATQPADPFTAAIIRGAACHAALNGARAAVIFMDIETDVMNATGTVADIYALVVLGEVAIFHPEHPIILPNVLAFFFNFWVLIPELRFVGPVAVPLKRAPPAIKAELENNAAEDTTREAELRKNAEDLRVPELQHLEVAHFHAGDNGVRMTLH